MEIPRRSPRALVAAFVLLAAARIDARASGRGPAAGPSVEGTSIAVPVAGVADWASLRDREARASRAPRSFVEPFVDHPPLPGRRPLGSALPAPEPRETAPSSPAATGRAEAPGTPAAGGGLASGTTLSTTLGFEALPDDNTRVPPDTGGAVGPAHLVTMLNTQVRIQDRTGADLGTVSLATFWTGGTGLSGQPFDPRIFYDAHAGRWLAVVDANGRSAASEVWLAVSETSDPTGGWTFWSFDADASGLDWADFPGVGFNATWIAIAQNMFTVDGLSFTGAKMWVIDKASALAGGPLVATVFPTGFDHAASGIPGATLQPAVTHDVAEPALHIVDLSQVLVDGAHALRLSRIVGTGDAPSWEPLPGSRIAGTGLLRVEIDFSDLVFPPRQPGTVSRLDGGRVVVPSSPSFRNGRLWTAHVGGWPWWKPVDRDVVLWYEVDPAAFAATGEGIAQTGIVDPGAGSAAVYPSIAANRFGDAVIGFTRSDATRFPEAAWVARAGTDPPGTQSEIRVSKAGEDAYFKNFGAGRNRWGDYSATVVDPQDDETLWTIQEYAAAPVGNGRDDDRWGTWWTRVSTTPPLPTPTASPAPACGPAPRVGCRTAAPGAGQIAFSQGRTPDRDQFAWTWQRGAATAAAEFGDPTGTTGYRLCMWAGGSVMAEIRIPSQSQRPLGCRISNPRPCWKATSSGFVYTDPDRTGDGVGSVKLVAGGPGRASVSVSARGSRLPDPVRPFALPVVAQLLSTTGECWESTFSAPASQNTAGPPGAFRDRAD
ncbi:hypothetical protein KGQ64_15090 [bacterium]|nr:hypothetical protein [bacterium]